MSVDFEHAPDGPSAESDGRQEPAAGEMTEAHAVYDVEVFTDSFTRLESPPSGG